MVDLFPINLRVLIIILNVAAMSICDEHYQVEIVNTGPIVRGARINFTATLYLDGDLASGSFKYIWNDNAIPEHAIEHYPQTSQDNWSVQYDHEYPPGKYEIQVAVKKYVFNIYPYEITSNRQYFDITETVNGNLTISQQNITRKDKYVSNSDPVTFSIDLIESDQNYVSNATSLLTYWFVDCVYYGPINGYKFTHHFTKPGEDHSVEVLMLADFTPLPPTTTAAPVTTTSKPNSTTVPMPNTTTTNPPLTTKWANTTASLTIEPFKNSTSLLKQLALTSMPTIVSNKIVKHVERRSILSNSTANNYHIMVMANGSLVPYNGSFPYICNETKVAIDDKKTYGYFHRKVQVKAPVTSVNVTGNNWLQHGDILTLNVVCQGSQQLRYCVQFKKGIYNVTGNEACDFYSSLDSCSFLIQRYLIDPLEHTVVVIIENEVSKVVKPVTVTVYKVKKQAQLSVIVVPVAFSLVAVVLIVFGVAYYIQNRSRFIVEVANFNFGEEYSDMDYKTFSERLRDSISNAFVRVPSPDPSDAAVWPPGRKYGSMT